MLRKLTFLFIALPIAIFLICLSVANRHSVTFSLDPLNSVDPAFSFALPLFVFLFIAFLSGLVLGGIATWFTQGKNRKQLRENKTEAKKWQNEAENQKKRAEELAVELNPGLEALPSSNKAA